MPTPDSIYGALVPSAGPLPSDGLVNAMQRLPIDQALGDPRGSNPTLQQTLADNRNAPGPNGPMPSMDQIQAYLRMTGQIYPPLTTHVNPAGWDAFLANGPLSRNIEDRRPR